MKLEDFKLPNSGIQCIGLDETDKVIGVIVPEGWRVQVMPSDSGQVLDRVDLQFGFIVSSRRVAAAPTIVNPQKPR